MFRCTQEGCTSRPFYSESALRDHVRSSTTCGEGRARAPPPKCGARLGDAGDMSFGPHKLGKGRCDSPLPPGTACGACHVFVYTDYSYGLPVGAQCAPTAAVRTRTCACWGSNPFLSAGTPGDTLQFSPNRPLRRASLHLHSLCPPLRPLSTLRLPLVHPCHSSPLRSRRGAAHSHNCLQ